MRSNPIERKARHHLGECRQCMFATVRYSSEIRAAFTGHPLPDALASKLRAQLCKVGQAILDEILGVVP